MNTHLSPLRHAACLFLLLLSVLTSVAQKQRVKDFTRNPDPAFFKSEEARRIGRQIVLYQRNTGGWPKNTDMVSPLSEQQRQQVMNDKNRRTDSTIDNDATTMEMTYLAMLYDATADREFRDAFRHGVEFLLSGQYDNGGWPQFWPETSGYHKHITYNDAAMVNVMQLLHNIAEHKRPFGANLTTKKQRQRAAKAYEKGIECILRTQIVKGGLPTIWCQQHDSKTLLPTSARSYELPSYCPIESTGIVMLLMGINNPDERIKKAIHGAMAWFDKYKLTGIKVVRTKDEKTKERNTMLIDDPEAQPLWARFYDLNNCEPYVCDRDGVMRRRLEDIGPERRSGYAWYGSQPLKLYAMYEKWAAKHDPDNRVCIDIKSKGANENGLLRLNEKPRKNPALFDVIVNPGESIQTAIEKAPEKPEKPFCILIKNGTYKQKVVIDRPNIVLVGESRDSTIIELAQLDSKPVMTEYKGKDAKKGIVELLEGADDCVISSLTIYNNYGSTIEPTTAHQMAVYGRATRTIILDSNIWADGNDALSLWAKGANGLYYHADLFLRCDGVDFLCPRGWCYATRCRFMGNGHAILWHDGRGDKSKKLVVTNSTFDAKCPTPLGRYHHDSQFFLINCTMTENILDQNIRYAYTDKVLDPCPWGLRTYYYCCSREGGNSGWLADNLNDSEEAPLPHQVTAQWVFGNRWEPEKRIRELWHILEY